jgi:predicted GH43/DUF377 family glycosyl hydrolase
MDFFSAGGGLMHIERFVENPLIMPSDVPPSRPDYEVVGSFNAGAITYKDEILLLLRVAERPKDKADDEELAPVLNPATGKLEELRIKHGEPGLDIIDSRIFSYKDRTYLTSISHLRLARSSDGRHFTIEPNPAVFPYEEYETFGLEDPRITQIGEEFFITYKVVSPDGICTALLKTTDFKNYERLGIIFCPENIDVVLFPEKMNGRYYALTRPVPKHIGLPSIWLASSPDLIHWGCHRPLILPRAERFDSGKVGASCVPIKTEEGWLEIYHGADEKGSYSLAAALLDKKDPSKLLARSLEPLMEPKADYELAGFYGNVVFSCGAVLDSAGTVTIYYGAADSVTAGATIKLQAILDNLDEC